MNANRPDGLILQWRKCLNVQTTRSSLGLHKYAITILRKATVFYPNIHLTSSIPILPKLYSFYFEIPTNRQLWEFSTMSRLCLRNPYMRKNTVSNWPLNSSIIKLDFLPVATAGIYKSILLMHSASDCRAVSERLIGKLWKNVSWGFWTSLLRKLP
jgi:hypothetical protein